MISVDTNVLLRRILDDDPEQSAHARRLFEREQEILVSDVVLAELVWVLQGKRYRLDGPAIREVVVGLLEDRRIVFEDQAAIWAALGQVAKASSGEAASQGPDFADALIVSKGAATAARLGRPYGGTFTFDEAALALDGMKHARAWG